MVVIEHCTGVEHPGWLALREALWPEASRAEHQAEMAVFLNEPARYVQFTADGEGGQRSGCSELASDATLRNRLSHAVHRALAFAETERVGCFRQPLAPARPASGSGSTIDHREIRHP